ncbi:hypothetical protein [Bradyrhizobium canariense]|uniref:Uncharacterized protein n=1 Tax=Bradyrhizobium canariense TaxID=255045 RepID=A0A1X3G313_9BRAD|nr:hypothetical protein [Bradyrhizobium canariense]OSI68687.1 hypothetical protein BSZ21_14235 [Bradyrhizobium canariense]OSI75575.1 hypothetical protein BSZ22_05765 [Bradyrhizobium canariense]OSI81726.1 hypothetical protein BSZ23_05280 [Bradyrhizobium canariense]OSI94817.1 hypothetical protein BSZ25_06020 [Bradyrhizobium canariense]OSI95964.1 hypothetical protein BSZ24_06130 [Bradyrhizobium canariense]
MPRGQFYTVFTLGFAAAVGLLGIVAGLVLLFWHDAYWRIVIALGSDWDWLSPLYLSLIVASAPLFVAYWMVRIQQTIVRWSGDRLIARLNQQYTAIEQTQGREYADEFMRLQAQTMIEQSEGTPFNLFGREKMLHAAAVAGVRPPT